MKGSRFLLILFSEGEIIPKCIGARKQVVDTLSELTLERLISNTSSGSISYEIIWRYYDDNFSLNKSTLLFSETERSYRLFPMKSIFVFNENG